LELFGKVYQKIEGKIRIPKGASAADFALQLRTSKTSPCRERVRRSRGQELSRAEPPGACVGAGLDVKVNVFPNTFCLFPRCRAQFIAQHLCILHYAQRYCQTYCIMHNATARHCNREGRAAAQHTIQMIAKKSARALVFPTHCSKPTVFVLQLGRNVAASRADKDVSHARRSRSVLAVTGSCLLNVWRRSRPAALSAQFVICLRPR
jgi:hypothetical protein